MDFDSDWNNDDVNDVLLQIAGEFEQTINELEEEFQMFDENTTIDKKEEPQQYKLSYFICSGEDSVESRFHNSSFIVNEELKNLDKNADIIEPFTIFKLNIHEDVFIEHENLKKIFLKARTTILEMRSEKQMKALSKRKLVETPQKRRLHITKLLHFVRNQFQRIRLQDVCENIKQINFLFHAEDSIKADNFLPAVFGSPATLNYNFVHGYLEWRWLHLTILLKIEKEKQNCEERMFTSALKKTEFEEELQLFIYDLLRICLFKFNNYKLTNITGVTAFPCTCVKELWLLLQLLIEKLHHNHETESFWYYLENALQHIDENRNSSEENIHILMKRRRSIVGKNIDIFSIWLVYHLVRLGEFEENGEFIGKLRKNMEENQNLLNNLIKNILSKNITEQEMRIVLNLSTKIIVDLWSPKYEIIVQFWEHFHKQINTNFFLPGDSTISLLVSNDSATSYIKEIKMQLEQKSVDINKSSYAIFIHALGRLLQKMMAANESKKYQRIAGRIFIKFTPKKWLSMNEIGIHNLINLFLTLAITGDDSNMEKIRNIFLLLPFQSLSQTRKIAAVKGLVALLILSFEKSVSPSEYAEKLLKKIDIKETKSDLPIMKVLIHGVEEIFKNSEFFSLGEYILLDDWIRKYLNICTDNDRELMFHFLNSTLLKIQTIITGGNENECVHSMLHVFYKNILPYVQDVFASYESIFWLPELAANLCLSASGQNGMPKMENLFNFFMNLNCKNTSMISNFFVMIASSDKINVIDPAIVVHNWIKCSIFSSSSNHDMKVLTNAVTNLLEFREMCDIETSEIINAKEPFYLFLMAVGQKYERCQDEREKTVISAKLHSYLKSFEKWALQFLQCQDGSMKIYLTISFIILHCSSVVYDVNKQFCFFKTVISGFILPLSLMLGKQQTVFVTRAIMKILPVLIQGISKLNFKWDQYLRKTIIDIIRHWTPHFKTASNIAEAATPFAKCLKLQNNEISDYIFEQFCDIFITKQGKKPDMNTPTAVNILREILIQIKDNEDQMTKLLRIISEPLFDHVLMCDEFSPSKKLILELFELLFKTDVFIQSAAIKEILVTSLKNITKAKLSFYSSLYFQFMFKLVKLNYGIVKEILTYLKDQILEVEYLRGGGRDGRLRQQFGNLEEAVLTAEQTNSYK